MRYTFKIGGEAGFGINASGAMFSRFASRSGYDIFDYIEYPSLVRGGHNALEILISDEKANFLDDKIDLFVCLNKETYEKHQHRLKEDSLVIYDENDFKPPNKHQLINLPFKKIVQELKGQTVMQNTVCLGASVALVDGDLGILLDLIKEQFAKKGEKVITFNQQFARAGYDYIRNNYSSFIKPILVKKQASPKLVISGNESFSLGAVLADCRFYAAYPMTPSSSVLHTLSSWQEKTKMVVRHPEDEISVVNHAIGASFAGIRSAIGTSGGGFSLMVESLSFAGIAEIPLVIFIAQRPGPATGMPTWTEQGELLFSIFAGHGEFPRIVLAPSDHLEMVKLSAEAFNLADIYQTPVIVLSDMYLSESHFSVDKERIDQLRQSYKINRGKIIYNLRPVNSDGKIESFLRYKITDDGISESLVPGARGYFYQANSYEHKEDGHTTEDAEERIKQVEKRNRKITTFLKNHFSMPEIFGDFANAAVIFVSWGATKGAICEAIKRLEKKNIKSSLIHFSYLYPLDGERVKELLEKDKYYVLVENNSQGQLGKLLRLETGVEIKNKILRYDGRPLTAKDIIESLERFLI